MFVQVEEIGENPNKCEFFRYSVIINLCYITKIQAR